jgi:hypothetical protein
MIDMMSKSKGLTVDSGASGTTGINFAWMTESGESASATRNNPNNAKTKYILIPTIVSFIRKFKMLE